MIIHHQNGRKEIITKLIKAVRTKRNRIVLCYQSPNGVKGIVEFTSKEVAEFMGAVQSEDAVDDGELFTRFCGVKPHNG